MVIIFNNLIHDCNNNIILNIILVIINSQTSITSKQQKQKLEARSQKLEASSYYQKLEVPKWSICPARHTHQNFSSSSSPLPATPPPLPLRRTYSKISNYKMQITNYEPSCSSNLSAKCHKKIWKTFVSHVVVIVFFYNQLYFQNRADEDDA